MSYTYDGLWGHFMVYNSLLMLLDNANVNTLNVSCLCILFLMWIYYLQHVDILCITNNMFFMISRVGWGNFRRGDPLPLSL